VTTIYAVEAAARELVPLPNTAAGRLQPQGIELVAGHGGAWVLINGNPVSQTQIVDELRKSLREAGLSPHIDRRRNFGDLLVVRLRVPEAGRP
jgi:hypothetical protein